MSDRKTLSDEHTLSKGAALPDALAWIVCNGFRRSNFIITSKKSKVSKFLNDCNVCHVRQE